MNLFYFFFNQGTLDKWLSLTNEQESPLDGTQKHWTQPVYVKTAQHLISVVGRIFIATGLLK